MGRRICTEPQCLYRRSIPLLTLWAVRPVQSLSACTVQLYLYSPYWPYGLYRASVPVQYSYTSNPPIGRSACTEPQCLYKGAPYLYLNLLPLGPSWPVLGSTLPTNSIFRVTSQKSEGPYNTKVLDIRVQPTSSHSIPLRFICILFPHLWPCLPIDLFPSNFLTKFCMMSYLP